MEFKLYVSVPALQLFIILLHNSGHIITTNAFYQPQPSQVTRSESSLFCYHNTRNYLTQHSIQLPIKLGDRTKMHMSHRYQGRGGNSGKRIGLRSFLSNSWKKNEKSVLHSHNRKQRIPNMNNKKNHGLKKFGIRKIKKFVISAFASSLHASSPSADGGVEGKKIYEQPNDTIPSLTHEKSIEDHLMALQKENDDLKLIIQKLENDVDSMEEKWSQNNYMNRQRDIIVERFEGEFTRNAADERNGELIPEAWWESGSTRDGELEMTLKMDSKVNQSSNKGVQPITNGIIQAEEYDYDEYCEEQYDDGTCPLEPDITFRDALRDRAFWLVGLLVFQSMSGIILSRNEELLQSHPVIVYFLTMLVEAGGNAGNQAAVRVIRGIALGTLNERTQKQFLVRELRMALSLSFILSMAGFIRAIIFRTPFPEAVAVTTALAIIVFSSVCLGAILPLILKRLGVDPAHSSTSIQVVMDILGVVFTVLVSETILDSVLGQQIIGLLPTIGIGSS